MNNNIIMKHNSKRDRGILGFRGLLALAVMVLVMSIGINSYAYQETPGTVLAETAKIRPTADTSGAPLASVRKNETVSICDEVTGADGKIWYQVFVNANLKGYIRSDLVQKAGSTSTATNTTTTTETATLTTQTTPAQLPETVATPTERRTATVVTNNVRIRKGASTQYTQVATANRGMVLTVTGETTGTDNKKWYQVSFNYNNNEITGFIRNDLVTFDSLPPETSTSQIAGTENNEGENSNVAEEPTTEPETEPQTVIPEEQTPQQDTQKNESQDIVLMNVDETPYILPAFEPLRLKWEGQDINAFKNGDFYLFYARKADGEEGWFMFDSQRGIYQRYIYANENAVLPKAQANVSIPLIIAIIVIVALLAAVGYLFIRVRELDTEGTVFKFNFKTSSDDEEDEDEEDEEEDEDEEVETRHVPERRPVRRPVAQRPVQERSVQERPNREQVNTDNIDRERMQRPRPQQDSQARPVRAQQDSQARPARPQQDSQARPVRPQQGQPRRRPNPNPNRPSGSRPDPNKTVKKAPLQNGYKAKNFLAADEDDDMEFIDI